MIPCRQCGHDNADGLRFCGMCGTPLAPPIAERRKVATILFCDVAGSTALGEEVDAETLRALMLRYFDEMRTAIERHGGTVEKFIGDAVVAVFGVPESREDDALRAVRAAAEMRERLESLNHELDRRHGARLLCRIGVNTGEVLAGDPAAREAFVTGDAVNVAARLEQRAAPGEVLLGEQTVAAASASLEVEPVEPIRVKGKAEPLNPFRLIAAQPIASARRGGEAPFVGRETEVEILERALRDVGEERTCRLLTIVGEPGVGKSRLVAEFAERVGTSARILRGRCLSYGEGITFWPIAEVVRAAARIREDDTPERAFARLLDLLRREEAGDAIALRVAQAIGLTTGTASGEEVAWAIRKLLEVIATRTPLAVVIDDIHWAEPALLELIAGLPGRVDAPVLVLCLARPELQDARPDWPVSIALHPLSDVEADALARHMLGDGDELRERVVARARGNPLFVEELAALLAGDGGSEARLPASLNAVLTARLDRLPEVERRVLEYGAIEGEVFHRGAVIALSAPDATEVETRLQRLAAKDFVRPVESTFADDAAFRFRHILAQEATYAGVPKRVRADLHERFARWLEAAAGERLSEHEEIVGYHLEQAYRYREELGPVQRTDRWLAARAGRHLGAAGRRALARADATAAASLLDRAARLLPEDGIEALALRPDLAGALMHVGDFEHALATLDDTIARAENRGDRVVEARARIERLLVRTMVDLEGWPSDVATELDSALPVLEDARDDGTLSRAWHALAFASFTEGRRDEAAERFAKSAEYARKLADEGRVGEALGWRLIASFNGRSPLTEVERLCDEAEAEARRAPFLEACLFQVRAVIAAGRGDVHAARRLVERAIEITEDVGIGWAAAAQTIARGHIELWCGDPETLERELTPAYERLEAMGETGFRSIVAGLLGEAMYLQRRFSEAARYATICDDLAATDDVDAQQVARALRAKLLARRGEAEAAERLAREAVALADSTDTLWQQALLRLDLAEVLRLLGRGKEAAAVAVEAAALYDRKGIASGAQHARRFAAELVA